MSRNQWVSIFTLGLFWLIYHCVSGFTSDDFKNYKLAECVDQPRFKEAIRHFEFPNHSNTTHFWFTPNARKICADEILENADFHQKCALFVTPAYFIVFGAIELLRRRQRSQKDRHNDLVRQIDGQKRMKIVMGDSFNNINQAQIISKSTLIDSYLRQENQNPELAPALAEVAKIVIDSKSTDAAQHFSLITEQLNKPSPNKSLVNTYWSGLKEILPVLKNGSDVAIAFEKLISALS